MLMIILRVAGSDKFVKVFKFIKPQKYLITTTLKKKTANVSLESYQSIK